MREHGDLFHPSSLIASTIDAAVESMLTGIESHHGLQWQAGLRKRPEDAASWLDRYTRS
jgi:hypothetical protein